MELEQIRIFRAAAGLGSLAAAADELYISHSTVSRAVAALERELGVRLLARGRRGVRPTPAGEALLEGGAALLAQAEALEAQVRRLGGKICEETERP